MMPYWNELKSVVQITSSDNGITSVTGNNKSHEPI